MEGANLSYSIKEIMDKLEEKVDKGFEKQELRFDKIDKKFDDLDIKYAKKTSVDRLYWIFWGILSGGVGTAGAYYGKILFSLISNYHP